MTHKQLGVHQSKGGLPNPLSSCCVVSLVYCIATLHRRQSDTLSLAVSLDTVMTSGLSRALSASFL